MEKFFYARSVAVVGVSNAQGNLGRAMVYNLLEFRYDGCIYLVGAKAGSFLGHKIYPSIRDLPEPVELAAILVPAAVVPDIVQQCGEAGIKRIVVESAGFGELGEERRGLEKKILELLERYDMRMIGPNCIGVINRDTGLAVPFMPFKAEAPPGRTSILSQSGGVGATMINSLAAENLGFAKFASIGNKLNVNEADLVEYLIQDDQTRSIFVYLEGIADGRRLMRIAAQSPKAIVAHKSNIGKSGSVIARSHSASLASDDRVVDAAFKQCGILRAIEQSEAVQMLKAFMLPPMQGKRMAIISRSGGHAVMAADAADQFGFELPPFPKELLEKVQASSRAKVIQFHNPMDLGDLFDLGLYKALAEQTLARDDIDAVLFIHNYQGIFDAGESRRLLEGLGEIIRGATKPLVVCVFTTKPELDHIRKLVKFPIFTDPREAIRALAWNRGWHAKRPLPLASEPPAGIDRGRAASNLQGFSAGQLPPQKVAAVLAAYGIPLIDWDYAETGQEAIQSAARLGYPLVLKTAQPEVIHKSDAGGVHVNIDAEAALRSAYEQLSALGPRVLLQKMAAPGLEWFVGGRQDHQFGPLVIVGLGGIYVELLAESAMRIAPIGMAEAESLLAELRGAKLLEGLRGQPRLDRQALLELTVRVSWLLHDFPTIQELDLNPVRVYPSGCMALDWRMLMAGGAG